MFRQYGHAAHFAQGRIRGENWGEANPLLDGNLKEGSPYLKNREIIFFLSNHKWPELEIIQNPKYNPFFIKYTKNKLSLKKKLNFINIIAF